MKYLKMFESFEESKKNVISISFDKETFNDIYWSVYYPAGKIDSQQDSDNEIMEQDDFLEATLDVISGEIRTYFNNKYKTDIKSNYDSSLRNLNINLETLTLNLVLTNSPELNMLEDLDSYIKDNIRDYVDNAFYTSDKIMWSIYVNGAHYTTTVIDDKPIPEKPLPGKSNKNNYSQVDIQKKIDNALDRRDFDTVRKLSAYLESKKQQ